MDEKLAAIIRRYIEGLPARLAELERAWSHLKYVEWAARPLQILSNGAHKLAGSGASFQQPEISRIAKQLELKVLELGDKRADAIQTQQIDNLMAELGAQIERSLNAFSSQDPHVEQPEPEEEDAEAHYDRDLYRIALVEDDDDQAQLLGAWLEQNGYHVTYFSSPELLRTAAERGDQFNLVLLDIQFPDSTMDGLAWAEQVHKELLPDSHLVMVSARTDLVARLRAMRAGAVAYLTKPIDLAVLGKTLSDVLRDGSEPALRVLCVDDDASVLSYYEQLLTSAGFAVSTLDNPVALLKQIADFEPDILVLDHMMPKVSGGDLARLLRQDARYLTLPIIIRSAASNALLNDQRFGLVNSVILPKGIDDDTFLAQIRKQVRLSHAISARANQIVQKKSHDHLVNQDFFMEQLDQRIQRREVADRVAVQITLDQHRYLLRTHGRRLFGKLMTEMEMSLAKDRAVAGEGCVLGEGCFLLTLQLQPDQTLQMAVDAFMQRYRDSRWAALANETISFSLGACALANETKLDDVLDKLEKYCADAAAGGGNQAVWGDNPATSSSELPVSVVQDLVKQQSFVQVYQSIINLQTRDTLFDSGLRVAGPDGQLLSHRQFRPYFSSHLRGGVREADKWQIDHAVAAMAQLGGRHSQEDAVVIRPFSSIAESQKLLPMLSNAISSCRVRGTDRVVLAFSESQVLRELPATLSLIEKLKLMHCQFMLTGAGSSEFTLQLIRDLGAIGFIKLHLSLGETSMKKAERKDRIKAIQAVMQPSTTLIAAGIEDVSVITEFWSLGVRYFQGYFIQQPDLELKEPTLEI